MVAGRTEEPICLAACDRGQMGLKERRRGHRRTRRKEGRGDKWAREKRKKEE